VSQPGGGEDNAKLPRSLGHVPETSFLMRLSGDRISWLFVPLIVALSKG
jgi:hypothetical protein